MNAWAAVVPEPRRVEFRPVAVPEPGPEDVVVRLRHSWISNGTEGSFIRGERIAGDTPTRFPSHWSPATRRWVWWNRSGRKSRTWLSVRSCLRRFPAWRACSSLPVVTSPQP